MNKKTKRKGMFVVLLLLCVLSASNAQLYNVTFSASSIMVECEREYDRKSGTCADVSFSYEGNDQYPFYDLHHAVEKSGLSVLNRECERICGGINDCRAYSVSSAMQKLQNVAHCQIYSFCNEVQGSESLFLRNPPFNCFVRLTNKDGVFKNYNDKVNPYAQTSRVLEVPVDPFMDNHISVNGVPDAKVYGIYPYKEIENTCEGDEYDCLFFGQVWLGATLFGAFAVILSVNIVVLVTKKNLAS